MKKNINKKEVQIIKPKYKCLICHDIPAYVNTCPNCGPIPKVENNK